MSLLRWDVLAVSALFAVPVLALALRGDFSTDDLATRLPWCLLAGWLAVAVVRAAVTPPPLPRTPRHLPADTEATP